MEIEPHAPKFEIFDFFLFSPKDLINTRLASSRSLYTDEFSKSYGQKSDFGPKCPNKEIRPQIPTFKILENFVI